VSEPTAEQPQVTATVSPAVPPRSRWGTIPSHLGRARTSTVVLSVLFLACLVLWVNIRPATPGTATTGEGSVVEQPVVPVPVVPVPTTSAPTPEPAPTTAPERTPTTEPPATTSTAVPTPTETPTRFPTTTPQPSEPLPDTTSTPTG
jgi:hypothetical protein